MASNKNSKVVIDVDHMVEAYDALSMTSLSFSSPFAKKNVRVRIVKPETLLSEMQTELMEAAELTSIHPADIRIVLDVYKWDKIKILEITSLGESVLKLRDIGIILNNGTVDQTNVVSESNLKTFGCCLICRRRSINPSFMITTACAHWFCINCFQDYLHSKIEIGDSSHFKCPYNFCKMFMDDVLVTKAMPATLKRAYLQLYLKDFITCNKYRRMCPTVGCNLSSYVNVGSCKTSEVMVQCDCGASYRFESSES